MRFAERMFSGIYEKIQKKIYPDIKSSHYFYMEKLEHYVSRDTHWLDIGCGDKVVPNWTVLSKDEINTLIGRCKDVVGIDYDYSKLKSHKHIKVRITGDFDKAPFKGDSFNLVTANMVVKHIKDPAVTLKEIHRVLKPNGNFVFHTVNFFNYQILFTFFLPEALKNRLINLLEGKREKYRFPAYYRMNTPVKIERLSKQCNFEIVDLIMVNSTPRTTKLGISAIFELFVIGIFRLSIFKNLRSNIVAVLQSVDVK